MSTLIFGLFAACTMPISAPAPAPAPTAAPAATAGPAKAHSLGYKVGVQKLVTLRAELQAALDAGRLADLHKTADAMSTTARALPATASDLLPEAQRDVAAQAQTIIDLFEVVDEAGDAGKRDESAAAIARYDAPIAALKNYVP